MPFLLKRYSVLVIFLLLILAGCNTQDTKGGTLSVERKAIIAQCSPQSHPQITLKQTVSQATEHTIYFLSGVHIYALNAGTGALKWCLSISNNVQAQAGLESVNLSSLQMGPPASPNGFAGLASQQDRVFVTSFNSFVYALAARDGEVIWQHNIDFASSMPTIADSTIYVPTGTIYALSTKDGAERWTFKTQDVVTSPPVIVGDTLYAGSYDNNIYALNSANGKARWIYKTDGRVYVAPIVDQGTVYAGAGNDGPRLLALDAQSGKLKWQAQPYVDSMSQLLVQDGLLYTCQRNNLAGLDPKDGRPVWKYPGISNASLLAGKHMLYVAANSGDLYAFESVSHRLLWQQKLRMLSAGQPSRMKLVGDELYVGFNDLGRDQYATIHAVNTLTGSEDWSARVNWNISTLDLN